MNVTYRVLACAALLASSSAFAQIVVVTGPDGPQLSKDKIVNGYIGRSFEFKPLDLPENSAVRDNFYRKLIDREPTQVKALWARVVFTGKGQSPLILPNADTVKKALATDPKAVGYIEKSAVDSSVKVLLTLD